MSFPDPFDTLLRLQRALDVPRWDDRFGLSTSGAGGFPPVNVFQRGHDFVVVAELPGLDKSGLTVEVQKNQLRLAGQRPATGTEGASVHRRERASGSFNRTVAFPVPLDTARTEARYEHGILTVTLPPAPEVKPRTVPVG